MSETPPSFLESLERKYTGSAEQVEDMFLPASVESAFRSPLPNQTGKMKILSGYEKEFRTIRQRSGVIDSYSFAQEIIDALNQLKAKITSLLSGVTKEAGPAFAAATLLAHKFNLLNQAGVVELRWGENGVLARNYREDDQYTYNALFPGNCYNGGAPKRYAMQLGNTIQPHNAPRSHSQVQAVPLPEDWRLSLVQGGRIGLRDEKIARGRQAQAYIQSFRKAIKLIHAMLINHEVLDHRAVALIEIINEKIISVSDMRTRVEQTMVI